jgi:UDP-glucuronate 4-epimerase
MSKILVTGAAGFIGFFLSRRLTETGHEVVGLDNLNEYYDVRLKQDRLKQIEGRKNFRFVKMDLTDRGAVSDLFAREGFEYVLNMAAQAGVRYSLVNPQAYVDSNITGFINVLEACRHNGVRHLVFASSSSVYGANTAIPFSEHRIADHPVSLYGATKRANELIAHAYADIFGLPCSGLRFFTVYGPWGRPDMALFLFTKAILEEKPIEVYNHGKMKRDFTYVDDVVEGVVRLMEHLPKANPAWDGSNPDPATGRGPFRVYNIGNHSPVELTRFIEIIEERLGRKASKKLLPIQPGDVPATYADVDDLMSAVGFKPDTPIEEGIGRFIDWYKDYYQIK